MRRTSWYRPFAVLLALWFPLIVGEPGVLHVCPMHGATAAAVVAVQHASHHHPDAPSHGHHSCSCIGCCTSSADAVRAPVAAITTVVVARYPGRAAPPRTQPESLIAPEHARPYTTGPPRELRQA